MARTEGDTWDLASGVGATATAVAASRALAHRATLIDDPWAEPLVKAVGMEMFLKILDGRAGDEHSETDLRRMALGMAVRTRYFDDFLTDAAADGILVARLLQQRRRSGEILGVEGSKAASENIATAADAAMVAREGRRRRHRNQGGQRP